MERTNHMEYMEGMEQIDSDMLDRVISAMNSYDYNKYTERDVKAALARDTLSPEDFAALLSPAALPFLEEMAQRAQIETRKHFGNSIAMFTPLYIANYCENYCIYCGFNCYNKIRRAKLTAEEIETEMQSIAKTGLQEVLLLTGESRKMSDVDYIANACAIAKKYFKVVGVEVYPMNSYRFYAQERAIMGGMRGVGFAALLGLADFRKDAFATGMHAYLLQKKYPHAEIAFSCPRLRPIINNDKINPKDVHEPQLLQVICAYRLFMPFASITISTREDERFRNNIIQIAATKISAGVDVGIGGHSDGEKKGDEQFEISDPRNVDEIFKVIEDAGLQPVMSDYIYV